MSTIVVGDLHVRREEPWMSVFKNEFRLSILDIIQEHSVENLIFLGDTFHRSRPYPEEIEAVVSAIKLWKSLPDLREVYFLNGNHEYNHSTMEYATIVLENHATVIDNHVALSLDGDRLFGFLPWRRDLQYYEQMITFPCAGGPVDIGDIDYLLYHFQDETIHFDGNPGVDLSRYGGKRLGGDIHKQSSNYVGTPYPTRYDERGQVGRYFVIDGTTCTEHTFPGYIDYVDVPFGKEVDRSEVPYPILDILSAPSIVEAKERYQEFSIHKVHLSEMETRDTEGGLTGGDLSLRSLFEEYATINKVTDGIRSYVQSLL